MFGRFVRIWLLLVLALTGGMAAFNAYVDPLWLFDHANAWNSRQWGFDERQQKVNRIQFGTFDYDALLLGSSRTTYISQDDFRGQRVFNLAASAMRPTEFGDYIAFAEAKRGQPFKVVYLGLDFFATNMLEAGSADTPESFIARAQKPLYRLESLLSYDTFNNARRYVRDSLAVEGCDCYGRGNVKLRPQRPEAERQAAAAADVDAYRTRIYGRYEYDPQYRAVLQALKMRFPHTRFVAFTTPESAALFDVLEAASLRPSYLRWLREITEVLGGVYDFMGHNAVTDDPQNYADAHHFYPAVGRLIAARLSGENNGFGRWVVAQGDTRR